jgi:hypothetical protein
MQDIANGGGGEINGGRNAALLNEREIVRERLDSSGHAVTAFAAQFNEIIRRGDGDQEASSGPQDTPEFGRIHPPRDREDERKGAVGEGDNAICIGYYPLTSWVAPRRSINSWNRDIHAMRGEPSLAGKAPKIKTVAAAGIKNDIAGRCPHNLASGAQQRRGHAKVMQPPPPSKGGRRVSRLLGSPLLRLKQIDVPAASDIKRMSARAE